MTSRIISVNRAIVNRNGFTRTIWKTPNELYKSLNEEFHFDFDPCPLEPKFNGLDVEWGRSNYVNPPYGKAIPFWLVKGLKEYMKKRTSVFLLPAYTDVKWFHDLVIPFATDIRFVRGRLKFDIPNPVGSQVAPFASMIVVFKP
jgi:hypothetical protein